MRTLRKNLSNILGWRTSRKIVVIESDDWGSIRTRSKADYDSMLTKGLNVDSSIFPMYDCLESNSDLQNLFKLLLKHKDSTGRPPVFTPMCILANPAFDKIRQSEFKEYHFELFTETCKKYPNHDKVHDLWLHGIKERLFVPALHGREHLSASRWAKALQSGNEGLMIAFNHQSFGVSKYNGIDIPEYLGAFHPDDSADIPKIEKIIEDAAVLFKSVCGYAPTHFIAPNREGPIQLDAKLAQLGVKYLTMSKLRRYPLGDDKYKREFNWVGKINKHGQLMIMRNCHFEPSATYVDYSADSCLKEIDNAFFWHKPAVISTHRVNYIGQINEKNAISGLKKLDYLLSEIIKKWPDVEFMTSTELGDTIRNYKNQ